jgi:hypothetical protein
LIASPLILLQKHLFDQDLNPCQLRWRITDTTEMPTPVPTPVPTTLPTVGTACNHKRPSIFFRNSKRCKFGRAEFRTRLGYFCWLFCMCRLTPAQRVAGLSARVVLPRACSAGPRSRASTVRVSCWRKRPRPRCAWPAEYRGPASRPGRFPCQSPRRHEAPPSSGLSDSGAVR